MSTETKQILTKKDVRRAAVTWHMTSHMTYNYQRLQAGALTTAMGPIFEKLYPNNNEKMIEGLQRHMLYFNTEPRWGAILPGMVVALEEGLAMDTTGEMDATIIPDIKTALMGPLAGIGDTLWAGLVKPIILSVILGWAVQGHIWGAWMYGIGVTLLDFVVTYQMFMRGYKLGIDSIDRFLEGGFVKMVTTALGIIGLFCLGAMIVKYVTIGAVYTIELDTGVLDLGSILNKIVPSLIPLSVTLLGFWLQVKGKSVTTILLILFVIGFAGGAVGLLG
ncbi:PTS system mannose/fructose/sorbose family transporter subunit IID [Breznakia pachnodae]|uniref:PTS system mannose-specific IID component n=1 Tax=Breznakia pachnodae TaxID=265178 RepID=A0ABU0DYD2_9FIRM|nr:PTS system mannose/fructose/sorbose family transporter subunit IID [Breznakia pachnodae]MDQ0359647.1 PTS system mannose-specific IID component [Breznakia pachnodae]